MAQLAARLLLNPEICSSNPVFGKILHWAYLLIIVENTKKEKEAAIGPFFKKWKWFFKQSRRSSKLGKELNKKVVFSNSVTEN